MTTSEKRLDSLTPRLTVRERVVLTLQPWLADGQPNERLSQNCPEHERAEMERLISAIERGNDQLGSAIAFNTEWAHAEEITFAWLECLQGFLAREQHQRPSPIQKLPPLPKPERGFVRELPMFWGRQIGEDDPIPKTWQEAAETLTRQMCRAIKTRWRCLRVIEEAFALGGEAFGHDVVHSKLRTSASALRTKVLDLHQAMQQFVAFALPELSDGDHEQAREYFDLDVLRGVGSGEPGARERLHITTREKLEAEEAELAAALRAESS